MDTEKRPINSKDLWKLKFVGDVEVSPDGKAVVWVETVINERRNSYESSIWISRKDPSGVFQKPTRLTYGRKSSEEGSLDRSPRFSPDGKYLAFLSNRSGKNHIWVLDMKEGGEARQLTQGDDNVSQIAWSPDGRHLAYVSREPKPKEEKKSDDIRTDKDVTVVTKLRYKANGTPGVVDPRPQQIFVVDVETGKSSQLTFGDFDNSSPAFSPDGKHVAFTSCREPDRELVNIPDLWLVPVEGGEPRKLTDGRGPVYSPAFSPDGSLIAFLGHEHRDDGASNTEVLIIPRGGGKIRHLTGDFDRSVGCSIASDSRFDAGRVGPFWSRDGKYIYFVATDKGFSRLYRTSVETAKVEEVTEILRAPSGAAKSPSEESLSELPSVVTSMAFADPGDAPPTLAFVGGTALNPGDVYVIAGDRLQRITRVNDDLLAQLELSRPEAFTFKAVDGLELEGWMMKPVGFNPGQKYPAVVEIHGGPHSTYGEAFFFEFQLLAGREYGVFYCNPRGSAGYGDKFTHMVVGDWGGMDYQDIMSLKDYVDSIEWVDKTRVGVTGGSYGGYMTNWIVGHTDRFRAAVTQRSISNMYTKYGTSDIGFFANKRGMGGRDLWDSESFIMERSPIRYAPFVKTPILILHSEEDYRCPMEQAEQWYVALKRLGKTVEFVRFAGENHELSRSGKPWNRVERLERIAGWFDRYLKNGD
ncbi:MAG TPA: S9 family peptidase [Firmicutes bacterium]|nr:S9 family peptidase [Candidatus Fermentithermobacillaceae bacterium]